MRSLVFHAPEKRTGGAGTKISFPFRNLFRNFRNGNGTSSKLENPERNGNGTAIFRPFLVPFRKEIVPISQALFWAVNHKTQEIMKEIQGFEAKNSRNLPVASKNAAEIL